MDRIATPWRFAYVTALDEPKACVFCEKQKGEDDADVLIVHRGVHCFVIINAYPYTSGHVMVVPYAHLDRLGALPTDAATEMIALTQRMERILYQLYKPDGLNLGMNVGKAAGAGVAGHIHMHVLPRWIADGNFMSTVGETRVLPEDLPTTYQRIKKAFSETA